MRLQSNEAFRAAVATLIYSRNVLAGLPLPDQREKTIKQIGYAEPLGSGPFLTQRTSPPGNGGDEWFIDAKVVGQLAGACDGGASPYALVALCINDTPDSAAEKIIAEWRRQIEAAT